MTMRGFAEERHLRGGQVRLDQLVLGGHGADDEVVAVGADAFEVGDAGKIDQMGRRGEAELHHRDEAMAAGERPGVVAEIGKQRQRIGNGLRAVVGEGAWYHGFLPRPSASAGLHPDAPTAHPR